MDSLLEKFGSLEIKDIGQFTNAEEVASVIDYAFSLESKEFLRNPKHCKRLHQLFLQISAKDQIYGKSGIRERLAAKIVGANEGVNGWDILRSIYYETSPAKADHSKDLLIVSFALKLITSLTEQNQGLGLLERLQNNSVKSLKLQSLEVLKVDNDELPDSVFGAIYFNLTIWYLLYSKYSSLINVSQYESSIPTIMSLAHLLTDEYFSATENQASNESITELNKIYRMIFVRLSELNSPTIQTKDIIYNELETSIILQTGSGKGTGGNTDTIISSKRVLSLLKNNQVIIQIFPQEFWVSIFQSSLFMDFLNDNIKRLVRLYLKDFSLSLLNEKLIIDILIIFESITVNDTCIISIIKNYLYLLLELCNSANILVSTLSSLVVVKCWNTYQQLKLDNKKKEGDTKIREISSEEDNIPESLDLNQFFEAFIKALTETEKSSSLYNTRIAEKYAIEGLAFVSLKVKFKILLRKNVKMFGKLVDILQKHLQSLKKIDSIEESSADADERFNILSSELVYGVVLIISNILTFNLKLSKEEESIEYLKNYSGTNTVVNNDERIENEKLGVQEKDDDTDIKRFLQATFKSQKPELAFIPCFNNIFKSLTKNIQDQLVKIIYNISLEKAFRVELVKQGGLNLVLDYLVSDDERYLLLQKSGEVKISEANAITKSYSNYTRLFALRALAKILISNNPNLIFRKYSELVPIPYLNELLDDESNYISGKEASTDKFYYMHQFTSKLVKPLDVLEALLSLTNIASIETMAVKQAISEKSWKYVENYILDSNELIQKSCLELISNLIFCPECTTKFFNIDNKESKQRLEILIKLINSSNIQIQIIVLTIFVNASEYEMISELLHDNKALFEKLVGIMNDIEEYYTTENEEDVSQMFLRIAYLVLNIVESVQDGTQNAKLAGIRKFKFDKGGTALTLKSGIEKTIRASTNGEVTAVAMAVAEKLLYI